MHVRIEGTYEDFITLSVELRNAADKIARDILELHEGTDERLARKVAVLQFAATQFEGAVFTVPKAQWTQEV